ncbi:hypothetical protein NE237_019154 [Protea cynaroides]|uniref:Uncharacterized protein n=1 Tax=Protea cynaroides TaxID=273540 RepID=A0A9Q0QPQ1_9MAGN|nr:hypothetical protein NE237_019154 [Protea cynaroides]
MEFGIGGGGGSKEENNNSGFVALEGLEPNSAETVGIEKDYGVCLGFSRAFFNSLVDGRKGPEEYWKDVMKDQPMPEVILGLLPSTPGSLFKGKTDRHTPLETQKLGFNSPEHCYYLSWK